MAGLSTVPPPSAHGGWPGPGPWVPEQQPGVHLGLAEHGRLWGLNQSRELRMGARRDGAVGAMGSRHSRTAQNLPRPRQRVRDGLGAVAGPGGSARPEVLPASHCRSRMPWTPEAGVLGGLAGTAPPFPSRWRRVPPLLRCMGTADKESHGRRCKARGAAGFPRGAGGRGTPTGAPPLQGRGARARPAACRAWAEPLPGASLTPSLRQRSCLLAAASRPDPSALGAQEGRRPATARRVSARGDGGHTHVTA